MCQETQETAKQAKREPGSNALVKVEPEDEDKAIVPAPEITEEQRNSDVQMDKSELIRMGHHGAAEGLCKGLERICKIFYVVMFVSRWQVTCIDLKFEIR